MGGGEDVVAGIEIGGGGGCGCGCVVPRESMPLRRSFEKSEVRFVGGCTAERGEPSGMLVGGRESGDDGVVVGVGVVGRGVTGAVATRLSATSVSSTAVGVPGAFSTENLSCRWCASVSNLWLGKQGKYEKAPHFSGRR